VPAWWRSPPRAEDRVLPDTVYQIAQIIVAWLLALWRREELRHRLAARLTAILYEIF
jgi:hypothetical protein